MADFKSVAYSPYELKFKSGQVRSGALLRFEFSEGHGFADCHPWTEFGDIALSDQLKNLSLGILTNLTSCSFACAKIDCDGRLAKKNSLADLDIPRSHYLITQMDSVSETHLSDLWTRGYRDLKLKVGRETENEISVLNGLFKDSKSFQLRLDFNGLLNIDKSRNFLSKLDSKIISQIEFIEDPIAENADDWFELQDELGLTLARDFVDVKNSEAHYFVRVAKPAVQDVLKLVREEPESVELLVTSYMDHPLGQAHAAFNAAMLHKKIPDRTLLPGLLHHHVYEPNAFSELLANDGPIFKPVEGTGFGFDQLLERQAWKTL